TEAGPMVPSRTIDPPPIPIDRASGIRKLVRTPATSTTVVASRGKPWVRTPTSDVVPPTSMTAQVSKPDVIAAPRIEFVGPEANVATGYFRAYSTSISVPSF